MELLLYAGFGCIVGSFLNVVVLRYSTGKTLLGRSGCASCRKELASHDLVPILSWLIRRGTCRYCGSRISLQYPIVEVLTALVWVVVGLAPISLVVKMFMLLLLSLWVLIAVYDVKHTVIPDIWSYGALGVAAVLFFVTNEFMSIPFMILSLVTTAGPLFLLWWGSSGKALGFGDVKLALSIGALLGPFMGFVAVMYGFVLGALWAVLVLLPLPTYRTLYTYLTKARLRHVRPQFTMKSEVPFGPFLILSACCVWILTTFDIHTPFIDAVLLSSNSSW